MQVHKNPEMTSLMLLCKRIDSPFSRSLLDKIEQRDPSILDVSIDPRDYRSAHDFRNDYMLSKFLSKWKGWADVFRIDTKAVAISSWSAAEKTCRLTNARLRASRSQNFSETEFGNAIWHAQRKIAQILGPLDIPSCLDLCEWTQGATADTKFGTPMSEKMSRPISVTRSALPYLRAIIESDPVWTELFLGSYPDGPCSLLNAYKIRDSNRFLTVPKTAKTDRSIAAEPAGNIFLQRGVGIYLRHRLARHGIRLDSQECNQRLALRAFYDSLSTLDLASASDTVSIEAVFSLLPPDWSSFLDQLRCKKTMMNGSEIILEKFSSMGNAFTFELETLLFYGLAFGLVASKEGRVRDIGVYGDDIIVPRENAVDLVYLLSHFGFDINLSKTFLDGDFFESCGKHYFRGFDVTPIYQKELSGNLQENIRLYNRLHRWLTLEGGGLFDGPGSTTIRFLRRVFNINERSVYSGSVPAIPQSVTGDDGYLVDPRWLRRFDVNHGYYCRVYRFTPRLRRSRVADALFAYKLRHSRFSNSHPKGWEYEVVKDSGMWRLSYTHVHPWQQEWTWRDVTA